jgi:hypothetical protein
MSDLRVMFFSTAEMMRIIIPAASGIGRILHYVAIQL